MKIDSFFTGDNNVSLSRKNPLYFNLDLDFLSVEAGSKSSNVKTFKDIFFDSISAVNVSQLNVSKVAEQSILYPNSVDVHDVTIAMSKANMNLSILKAVVDRSIKAYQDIINIR